MIIIGRGKLYRNGGEEYGVPLPAHQYQVRDLAGRPMEADYTGPGFDNGDNVRLGHADSCALLEYRVDPAPTEESQEEHCGALVRLRQIRATFPVKASAAFQDGWKDADRALRAESPDSKAARLGALRAAKAAARAFG